MKIQSKPFFFMFCLFLVLIVFGYRLCGDWIRNEESLSEFHNGYDSATIYYSADFWEARFIAWETNRYLDEKLYDAILEIKDIALLDSLNLFVQRTINQKQIDRFFTDSFIVIVACSREGKDTLSLSNYPGFVEINNRGYPDSSLFWWSINRMVDNDESWVENNDIWMNIIAAH